MAPIDTSDQAQIIRMMDDDDGAMAVRKRKGPMPGGKSPSVISAPIMKSGSGKAVAKKLQQSDILRPLLESEKPSILSTLNT